LSHFDTSRTSGNVRLESGKWAKADTVTIGAGHPASALRTRVTIKLKQGQVAIGSGKGLTKYSRAG